MRHIFSIILLCGLYGPLVAASDWPMYRGNHYLTGNNDQVVPRSLGLAWKWSDGARVFQAIASDGRVYCTSMKKRIYCLDLEQGKQLWQYATTYPVIRSPVVYGKHLFVADGRRLLCLDKWSGKAVWARSFRGFSQLSTPIAENGVVYYGNRGSFFARCATNGHELWRNQGVMSYGGSPIFSGGRIYTQHRDYRQQEYFLVCLDAQDGKLRWRQPIPRDANVFTPVVYGQKVYMTSAHRIQVFHARSGKLHKERRYESRLGSSPAVIGGRLYLSDTAGKIRILDPETLQEMGAFPHLRPQGNRFSSVGGRLYLGDNQGNVFELDRNSGHKLRSWTGQTRATHSLPLLFEGRILVAAGTTLFCLGKGTARPVPAPQRGRLVLLFQDKKTGQNLTGPIHLRWSWGLRWNSVMGKPTAGKIELQGQDLFPSLLVCEKKGYLTLTTNLHPRLQGQTLVIRMQPVSRGDTLVFHDILFNHDSSGLRQASLPVLQRLARFLKRNPGLRVRISGHTDNTGKRGYNLTLSRQRAAVVRGFLIKANIEARRMTVAGYGPDKPLASNNTAAGRRRNRRVEVKILGLN